MWREGGEGGRTCVSSVDGGAGILNGVSRGAIPHPRPACITCRQPPSSPCTHPWTRSHMFMRLCVRNAKSPPSPSRSSRTAVITAPLAAAAAPPPPPPSRRTPHAAVHSGSHRAAAIGCAAGPLNTTHSYTHTCTAYTHVHTQACTHARTRARTRIRTHTHRHTSVVYSHAPSAHTRAEPAAVPALPCRAASASPHLSAARSTLRVRSPLVVHTFSVCPSCHMCPTPDPPPDHPRAES